MIIIPVIIGAFALGGAFDLFHYQNNRMYKIFDYNAVKENLVVEEHRKSVSRYQVIESTKEAYEFLGVEPALGLKSMNGDVAIFSLPNMVHDNGNTVTILMVNRITTVVETFPTTVKHGKRWQNRPQRVVGTHYIKAVEYGGQLFIRVQLKVSKQEDMEEVRALVNNKIGKEGSMDEEFFKQLEVLAPLLADKVFLQFGIRSTGGSFDRLPTTVAELRQLVEEYPSTVENLNGGKGAALTLGLEDLHSVQSNFTEFKVSRNVEQLLIEIEDKYDDLLIAIRRFKTWEGKGHIRTLEQQKKIDEYFRRLGRTYREMSAAIRDLDVTGSTSQFDRALRAYDYDGQERPYRFISDLQELMKNIEGNSLFRTIYSSLLAIQGESRPY